MARRMVLRVSGKVPERGRGVNGASGTEQRSRGVVCPPGPPEDISESESVGGTGWGGFAGFRAREKEWGGVIAKTYASGRGLELSGQGGRERCGADQRESNDGGPEDCAGDFCTCG